MRILFALTMLASPLMVAAESLTHVNELVWKNRIILVWSNHTEPFINSLTRARAEIDDRDVVWFVINGDDVVTNYRGKLAAGFAGQTTQQFHNEPNKVLLIGKDGGVKERDTELLLGSLLREIDSMPMRVREMGERP